MNNAVRDSLMATTVINAVAAPSAANIAPVANAGADQVVTTGATVNLDGTLSKDANGDRLNYLWTLVTRPGLSNASLGSALLGSTSFRADSSGVYEVRLTVNDGKTDSATSDLISIVAQAPSAIVIADSGSYRCSALSKDQALALYAAGHTYLDRDHDGKPCEANDLLNELTSPYIAPAPANSGQCWVNGYTKKSGTYVHGYLRSC
ncbi:MAG: PKD domain-containing protein [Pseudomonadota bacterium]|nr:PKD domain-containing protein [Pseudomonadota bacterium]